MSAEVRTQITWRFMEQPGLRAKEHFSWANAQSADAQQQIIT